MLGRKKMKKEKKWLIWYDDRGKIEIVIRPVNKGENDKNTGGIFESKRIAIQTMIELLKEIVAEDENGGE